MTKLAIQELKKACKKSDLVTLKKLLDGQSLEGVKFKDVFNNFSSPIKETLEGYSIPFTQKIEAVKLLLIKGDKPNIRQELGDDSERYLFFINFIEDYLKNPDPSTLDERVATSLKVEWDKCTKPVLKALEKAAKKTDKKHDGFRFNMTSGKIYIESMNKGMSDEILKAKINNNLYCMEDNDAIAELPIRIRADLQKMVDKGVFDHIMSSDTFPIIIWNRYSNHHAKEETIATARNDTVLENARKEWNSKLTAFKNTKNKRPLVAEIASTLFFGKEITEPDPQQAIEIVLAELYQSKDMQEAREMTILLREFEQYHDLYAQIQYQLGLFYKHFGNINYAIQYLKDAKGYPLAQEALDELGYKEPKQILAIEQYTENDLNRQTDHLNAKASTKNGLVKIKFNHENEAAYLDALNFLNNLMDKGYSTLFDGYELAVKFIDKPVYLDVPNFPNAPVHAFFAKAVTYPALHAKIRQYAENTLKMYDWYHDLNGEHSAGTGTFAACALAISDIKYLELLSLLADETDGEHQDLQLNMIPVIIKQYGVNPNTAPILFDLIVSYGQLYEIDVPPQLYTAEDNLAAILKHTEQVNDSKIKYFIDHWYNLDDEDATLNLLKSTASSAKGELKKMYKKLAKIYKANML